MALNIGGKHLTVCFHDDGMSITRMVEDLSTGQVSPTGQRIELSENESVELTQAFTVAAAASVILGGKAIAGMEYVNETIGSEQGKQAGRD